MGAAALPVAASILLKVPSPAFVTQTASAPKAMAVGYVPTSISSTGRFVVALMRVTLRPPLFATQTDPWPVVMPAGVLPTSMVWTTARVDGSILETVLDSAFVTHTAPSPTAMPAGCPSTLVAATISLRPGSMTPIEFSATPASAFGRQGLQTRAAPATTTAVRPMAVAAVRRGWRSQNGRASARRTAAARRAARSAVVGVSAAADCPRRVTTYRRQVPGTPFSSRSPRSSNCSPEPAARSRTVLDASSSLPPAAAMIRAAVGTLMPVTFAPLFSTSPTCNPARIWIPSA